MKHLQYFENIKTKKYIIFTYSYWNWDDIYLARVVSFENNNFEYDHIYYYDKEKLAQCEESDVISYDISNDFIILYQTDDKEDGLKQLKLIYNANKYNL